MIRTAPRRKVSRALAAALAAGLAGAFALPVIIAAPATADTPAPTTSLPSTVSADALPTVQINGVAWSQLVIGNTVYVTGQFTSARPAGSPAGTNETARSNILAYDITTGNLITSFTASLNAQGFALAASPDGKTLYVGGEFTTVNGVTHNRLVALNAATGALVPSFSPNVNYRVRSIVTVGTTVYAGGQFTAVNGKARTRLAALNAADGTLLPWAPVADDEVYSMVAPSSTSELVVAGRFDTLNGETRLGSAAIDLTTGANLPWAVQSQVYAYGPKAAVYSLSTDGTAVFGTAYNFAGAGNFENSFAAEAAGGTLRWANGCLGDTYSATALAGVLYTAGHAHDCSALPGGKPEHTPRDYQYAQATTTAASNQVNGSNAYLWSTADMPAPSLLQWEPTFTPGSYTGQTQAVWSLASNNQYVVAGGEFPTINGAAQQGLTRFAVRTIAANKQGPQTTSADLTPVTVSAFSGTVRATVRTAWDRDDATLTYDLLRGSVNPSVVATVQASSQWWNRPLVGLTDPSAPAGTKQTYRIRVTDPSGNSVTGGSSTVTVAAASAASSYANQVRADGASDYWRLGESAGATVGVDSIGSNDLRMDTTTTRGAAGATPDGDAATTFPGLNAVPVNAANPDGDQKAAVPASTTVAVQAPSTVSIEAWIKTTATTSGKIIGFGDNSTANSSNYDRHVWMTDDGHLSFGAYSGGTQTITSTAAYNDGQWHHVVATMGGGVGVLYVDGVRVARQTSGFSGQDYTGFWKIGNDTLGGWPGATTSWAFTGTIDDVAIYPTVLTAPQVASHYTASGRTPVGPVAPADAYGKAVFNSSPDSYWRLEDAAGSASVTDTSGNAAGGVVAGGATLASAGIQGGKGAAFNGTDAGIGSAAPVDSPTSYSEELWFNTTTSSGGKLIGFGNAQSGLSNNYDRHVYMDTSGKLLFGTWTGQANIAASTQSYNDGAWHHMVATQGSDGMKLYVDGALVGTNSQTQAQSYSGYWRVGGDNLGGWPNQPSSNYFAGSIDEVATYSSALSAATVAAHYTAGGGTLANAAPTASFTSSVSNLAASFDASASADADGSVAGYAWDFGDGSTGTGAKAAHTYTAAGTYQVKLTVTDDKGATGTVTNAVTVAAAPVPVNAAPTASFTSSVSNLAASFDASASADADGSVAGYAWDFGDGSTGTGAKAAHTYTAAGTYQVKLTVTDDKGATGTVTNAVTVAAAPVPVNAAPTASFTSSVSNLAASFDASASADADGSVAGYAWDFGDGSTGTGAKAAHTYTAAGTYQVKLTVTDDKGATGTVTNAVTVAAAPVNTAPTAADSFARTVTGGWGTADTGGAWTVSGGAGNFSVAGGAGAVKVAAGATAAAYLNGVTSTSTDTRVGVSVDKAATGGGVYFSVVGRRVGTNNYESRARVMADGSVSLTLSRNAAGTYTTIKTVTVPGLTVTAGQALQMRLVVTGTSPTTLSAKVWAAGTTEPTAWTLTSTDATAGFQSAGSVGVVAYLSASSTATTVASFTNLVSTVPTP